MVKETEYYDILGVSVDVTEVQIKKSYRTGALKHHPDKNNGDDEMFKKITTAYEVLSDPQKRAIYDQHGQAGLEGGAGMGGGMDPGDLFSQLFGGGGGFGGQRRPQGPRKGKDLVHRITCTLEELYLGKKTKLSVNRTIICTGCEGRGGKAGSVQKCTGCSGQGVKIGLRQMGPMVQRVQMECDECDGKGEKIPAKDRCKTCSGKKTISKREVIEVHIDRGMSHGEKLTFNGAADQYPGTVPGDVVIVIEEKPHDFYKRKGSDLYCNQDIDLLTALGGGSFSLTHLDNHALFVDIPAGEVIKPGATKVISGHGMPSRRHHDLGNLFVTLNVIFPDSISPELISGLESALPARKAAATFPSTVTIEQVALEEVDETRRGRAEAMETDEEEDHEHTGQPGVQCANQ